MNGLAGIIYTAPAVTLSPGRAGIAKVGFVCEAGLNVAIVEDAPGTYSGFATAAHEIGHV